MDLYDCCPILQKADTVSPFHFMFHEVKLFPKSCTLLGDLVWCIVCIPTILAI